MSGSTANQEEEKKPNDQGGAQIILKVKGQDGNEVFFGIKRSTQLKKLMYAYCDRQSVDFNSIVFFFDGRRLRREQTPDELEMEDGDEIDALAAMLRQTGPDLPPDISKATEPAPLQTQPKPIIYIEGVFMRSPNSRVETRSADLNYESQAPGQLG